MDSMKQGLSAGCTSDLSGQSDQPKLFYARRMTMIGILLSAMALLVLSWMVMNEGAVSIANVLGYVFFTFILLMNIVVHFRPYVRIGQNYVQVYSRRAYLNQIVKYEDFIKGFIINFNSLPGQAKYAYDERLLITYNRVKDDDKPKLVYALNETMLRAKAKKDAVK